MSKQVISFHYVLKDREGKVLDSSQGSDPLAFVEGTGHIIPGLEVELKTLKAGEKRSITVLAAQAYGEYDSALVMEIPRTQFDPKEEIAVGDQFRAGAPGEAPMVFTVTGLSEAAVNVDGNHPLAGQDLYFEVEMVEIRPATVDEIEHGHPHGPGGHHHH